MDVNSSSHPHPHQTYTANALDPAIDALPPSQTPTLNDQHVSPATQTEKAAPAEMTPAPTPLSKDETGLAPAEAEKDAIERKADLDEDEIVYPTKLKLFLISLALCLAVFLVALVCVHGFFPWVFAARLYCSAVGNRSSCAMGSG